jgi:hypothetical protein
MTALAENNCTLSEGLKVMTTKTHPIPKRHSFYSLLTKLFLKLLQFRVHVIASFHSVIKLLQPFIFAMLQQFLSEWQERLVSVCNPSM